MKTKSETNIPLDPRQTKARTNGIPIPDKTGGDQSHHSGTKDIRLTVELNADGNADSDPGAVATKTHSPSGNDALHIHHTEETQQDLPRPQSLPPVGEEATGTFSSEDWQDAPTGTPGSTDSEQSLGPPPEAVAHTDTRQEAVARSPAPDAVYKSDHMLMTQAEARDTGNPVECNPVSLTHNLDFASSGGKTRSNGQPSRIPRPPKLKRSRATTASSPDYHEPSKIPRPPKRTRGDDAVHIRAPEPSKLVDKNTSSNRPGPPSSRLNFFTNQQRSTVTSLPVDKNSSKSDCKQNDHIRKTPLNRGLTPGKSNCRNPRVVRERGMAQALSNTRPRWR